MSHPSRPSERGRKGPESAPHEVLQTALVDLGPRATTRPPRTDGFAGRTKSLRKESTNLCIVQLRPSRAGKGDTNID